MSTNLLLVSPYSMSFYGGVQNQLGLIKKYLPEDDFNVKYLCPDSPDFNLGKSMKISFNGAIAPIKLFVNKSTLREATKWADIVHLHEPFIPMFFWRLPINKKTIITHHASLSKVIGLIQKMFIKSEIYAHTVTAVSAEASKNTLNKVQVEIIANAIERKDTESIFNPAKEFLFVGRDEKRKNFQLYERLSKNLNNDEYTFRAITNKKKTLSNITLHVNPNDKEKEDILENSSIYLAVNTHGESFGITIIEAVNSGCVAICSDINAFKDLMEDSGVYFKNNNLESLKKTIEELISGDINIIYAKQKKHIEKYFINKVMSSWISLYAQI